MKRRRMLVIWNEQAGSARDAEQAMVRRALAAAGVDAEVYASPSEEAAVARVRDVVREPDRWAAIVAAGGDGTVRSVALELAGTSIPLGILPLGTAMNVANGLGLPLELEPAIEVLASGEPHPIDLGEVAGEPFLEVASIGLTADVLAEATRVDEGRWAAALDLVRRARRHPRTRIRLLLDGREIRTRANSLVVANGPYTGRGMLIAPNARLDDGQLDVVVFRGFEAWRLGLHLVAILFGRHSDPRIRSYRARKVRVETRRPLSVRADSRDLGRTPVELAVRPAALQIIAPRSQGVSRKDR